jgi:hypothetical protein
MTGRRSSAVELALRLVRDGASPTDAAKLAGCHVRSVRRALKALEGLRSVIEERKPQV